MRNCQTFNTYCVTLILCLAKGACMSWSNIYLYNSKCILKSAELKTDPPIFYESDVILDPDICRAPAYLRC